MQLSKGATAILLSRLQGFNEPNMELEQYMTPSQMAVDLLYMSNLSSKKVADFGAGTGILSAGALLCGATHVFSYEVDEQAVLIMTNNLEWTDHQHPCGFSKIINEDVLLADINEVDIVVMNPPFGTKQEHIDRQFLDIAITKSSEILSIHKSSTMAYLKKHMEQYEWDLVKEQKTTFPLKNTMPHHTKPLAHTQVSLCQWSRRKLFK